MSSTPTVDGAPRIEQNSTKKNGVDAGVQVNLIGEDHSLIGKEQE